MAVSQGSPGKGLRIEQRLWFRWVALAEATSFILLLAATVVKYAVDQPEGVTVLGPIHGVLFLAYVALVIFEREDRGWTLGQTLLVAAGAVIPFGGFWVERRFLRDPAPGARPPALG